MGIEIYDFNQLSNQMLYQILKLRVDVFVADQNCPYPELDNKDQSAQHVVGYESNELSSYLRIYYPDDASAAIGRIVTREQDRGRGLATKMMKFAMDRIIEESKANKIIIQAQEHLVSYYSEFGFKPTSEVYVWDGIPHVDMEYEI